MSGQKTNGQCIIAVNGQTVTEITKATIPKTGAQLYEVVTKYKISIRFVHSNRKKNKPLIVQGTKPPKGSLALLLSNDTAQVSPWDELLDHLQPDTTEIWAIRPAQAVVVLINAETSPQNNTNTKKKKAKART